MDNKKRKKVGLALGGGVARGLAHVGVIKALVRAGIPIDAIAGTSMGALVGGIYAATGDLEFVDRVFSRITSKDIVPLRKLLVRRDGVLFRDQAIAEVLKKAVDGKTIEACHIPFAAVATDVANGEAVVLRTGKLEDAIQASISLPFIFQPVKHGTRLLMDGGLSNPVPADVVSGMGVDYIIAVDVASQWMNVADARVSIANIYGTISNALGAIEFQLSREILKKADIVLRPQVLQFDRLAFDRADDIILAGVDEVERNIKQIARDIGHALPEETPLERLIDFIRGE